MNFAHPAWLLLLLLVPAVAITAVFSSRFCRRKWSEFLPDRLRSALLVSSSPLHRVFALVFLLAACVALIVAISRPQGDAGTRVEKSTGRNVMIALDLSRSMRTADVKPDRLAQAKIVIEEMIEAMPNERFGLIGFAGQAYVYAPLTIDHAAVRETVSQIDETWAPSGGTNIHNAVRLAIKTLKQTGQRNNALVLISDGEKHDGSLDSLISEAKRAGVYILTVGVGTADGGYVPDRRDHLALDDNGWRNGKSTNSPMTDRSGRPVISRLQQDVLRNLATGTNGHFAIAGGGLDIPDMVRSVIKDLDAFETKGTERRVVVEFYQWLVLPAIVFLMIALVAGTRWRGKKTAVLPVVLFFLMAPQETRAADSAGSARNDLHDGKLKEAAGKYQSLAEKTPFPERKAFFHAGEAEAKYRAKEWDDAISSYSSALLSSDPAIRSRVHSAIANALFQKGWIALSAEPYQTPETKDFSTFEKLVNDYLSKIAMALFSPPTDEGPSIQGLRDLITNWSDAVRHWETAAQFSPDDAGAKSNATLARAYLKRLQELLKELSEQSQQQAQGQGNGNSEGEGDGDGSNGDEENQGNRKRQNDGSGGQKKQDDGDSDKDDKEKDNKPGETAEEKARRKLKENSDLERGPLSPGRSEYRDPDKDW